MKILKIREPIWKFPRSIGIASKELSEESVQIEITYKTKDGKRLFPDIYEMKSHIIKRFPTQRRKGVTLYIVPIEALNPKGGTNEVN
jgi:hypothetical protein